jgi:farnesyl diphosphate synthase
MLTLGRLLATRLQENVGNIAINDSFMLEAAIYFLLKKHFRQEKYYVDLLEIFHEVRHCSTAVLRAPELTFSRSRSSQTTFQTEMGQLIDLITAPEDSVDLSKFSLDK